MKSFNTKALVLSALICVAVAPAAQAAVPGWETIKNLPTTIKEGYKSVWTTYKDEKGGVVAAAKNPWAYGTLLGVTALGVVAYFAWQKYSAKSADTQKVG